MSAHGGLLALCRSRPRAGRVSHRPVHTTWLGLLGAVRHEHHVGGPGSAQGLDLIVSGIAAARQDLVARGAEISEVFHAATPGAQFEPGGTAGRLSGPPPEHGSYQTFATFGDPDGDAWLLQEITARLPGRIAAAETAFASTADLASALRRAAAAHGEYEKREGGEYDVNWPDWYAAYMVAEQAGTEPPT